MATNFSTYRGAFAQKIYDEAHDKAFDEGLARGRDEGLARGRDEGLARGRDEGLARGARLALLTVLSARGITLSTTNRERIEATLDCAELELWTARAARATREEDLFAG
jgi:flagellar biosynthesis/type III secretory pathway protein FliH